LLPDGELPRDLFAIRAEPLDEQGVAALLRDTASDQPFGQLSGEGELRLSIAGAQEKTALLRHQGKWQRPIGSTPTTHILKLPMGLVGAMRADMRTSIENEWLCSRIVAAFGLPVAQCDIARFDGMKALVVERIDRRVSADGRWIVRLPQEDMCQATGTSPVHKYQADGGPGISRIMEILLGAEHAHEDRVRFFKTQVLFWLLAAPDGHAKNFSIFHLPGSQYRATPLYDILSAHPIVGTGAHRIAPQRLKLAMAVRGSQNYYLMSQIRRRHWLQHAGLVGLGHDLADAIIRDILDQVSDVIARVQSDIPGGFPEDVAQSIFQGMTMHANQLERMADARR